MSYYHRLKYHPQWEELKKLRRQKSTNEAHKLELSMKRDILKDQKVSIMEEVENWISKDKPFRWSGTRVGYNIIKYFKAQGKEVTFLAHLDLINNTWKITYISFGDDYMRIQKDIESPNDIVTSRQAKVWATKVLKERLIKTVRKTLS